MEAAGWVKKIVEEPSSQVTCVLGIKLMSCWKEQSVE